VSRRAARRRTANGASLIELLVVLIVVGVLLGAIGLALGGSGSRELETAAQRTRALVDLACARAQLTGVDVGWLADAEGLRFGYFRPQGWQVLGRDVGDELRPRPWPAGIDIDVWREGERLDPAIESGQPQFACLASGEATPFRLQLRRQGVEGVWTLQGTLDATLTLEHESAQP